MRDKRTTLIATPVEVPRKGVVFVHASRPDRPMIVVDVDRDGEITRVDPDGDVSPWGSEEDWFDEVRRRTIEVVFSARPVIDVSGE